MTFPACFNNQNEFDQWIYFRKVSTEKVTICDDCTAEYKTEMQLQERCHPPVTRSIATPPKDRAKKCCKCGTTDEARFSPKNYYRCKECGNAWKRELHEKLSFKQERVAA